MRKIITALLLLALPSCAMMAPPTTRPAFLVFFDEHSASLDTAGIGVIAQAAAAAKASPGSPVAVLGYTDSAGSPAADVLLSQQRAQAVADALVADGVQPGRIARHGRGQTHDDPGQASRRVEIDIGG
jgi:outer membrane protein OmpA-like peptidoglycan-associated protein